MVKPLKREPRVLFAIYLARLVCLFALLISVSVSSTLASGEECRIFHTFPKDQLLASLESPQLADLDVKQIRSASEPGDNFLSWCLFGELLRRLGAFSPDEGAVQNREEFRRKVFNALINLDSSTIPENGILSHNAIRVKLALKIGLLEKYGKLDLLEPNLEACDDGSCFAVEKHELQATIPDKGAKDAVISDTQRLPKYVAVPTPRPAFLPGPEKTASVDDAVFVERCLPDFSIFESPDPDIRENGQQIIDHAICYTVHTVRDNGTIWVFQSLKNRKLPDGPVWFLPHDNESTAFTAAIYAIGRYGGRIISIQNNEDRYLGRIDPNRNFGETAKEIANCRRLKGVPAPEFSRFVYHYFSNEPIILAMHNNSDGGGVSVNIKNTKVQGLMATDNTISRDPDDLVYVAGSAEQFASREMQDRIKKLRASGLNLVLEKVDVRNNDCSFSNYAVLRKREYYNIDVQHNHLETQKKMIDALMANISDNY
ncbi:MAG: hypothetical protein P1V13_15005 [Rhizobiaceae bacterium]|nr:hypothetical protein [Rhizobiaceae bacterium]